MNKIPEAGKKAEEEAAADLDRTETREALEGEIPGTLILRLRSFLGRVLNIP